MRWTSNVASRQHNAVPILVGTREAWASWRGTETADDTFSDLAGVDGVASVDGVSWAVLSGPGNTGVFYLGVSDEELVLLHTFERGKMLAERKAQVAERSTQEYLGGVLDVADALVVGDAWTSGWTFALPSKPDKVKRADRSLFVVPRASGRYVVLEGRDDQAADAEAVWLRILRADPEDYVVRPPPGPKDAAMVARDLVHEIFTPRVEGKQLVATRTFERVKRIVSLGQTVILEERIAELASTRPAYARWLGLLVRAANGGDARNELLALIEEWLAPATSVRSANQHVSKVEILEAFDAVDADDSLAERRVAVSSARAPEVFVEDGDFF